MVTLGDIKANQKIHTLIDSANAALEAIGYTDPRAAARRLCEQGDDRYSGRVWGIPSAPANWAQSPDGYTTSGTL